MDPQNGSFWGILITILVVFFGCLGFIYWRYFYENSSKTVSKYHSPITLQQYDVEDPNQRKLSTISSLSTPSQITITDANDFSQHDELQADQVYPQATSPTITGTAAVAVAARTDRDGTSNQQQIEISAKLANDYNPLHQDLRGKC